MKKLLLLCFVIFSTSIFSQCNCAKNFGGHIDDYIGDIAKTKDGFLMSMGTYTYGHEGGLYKFDFNCNLLWEKKTGYYLRNLIYDNQNNFYAIIVTDYRSWYTPSSWEGITIYPGRTLVKFNSSGTPIWSQNIGEDGYTPQHLFIFDNNIYVVGVFNGMMSIGNKINLDSGYSTYLDHTKAFIAKFDFDGEVIDAKMFGGDYEIYTAAEMDNKGNIFMARQKENYEYTFLEKIDKNLNLISSKKISSVEKGTYSNYLVSNIYFNPFNENIYLWGAFTISTNFEDKIYTTGSDRNNYFQTIFSSFKSNNLEFVNAIQINNNSYLENPIRQSYSHPNQLRGAYMSNIGKDFYIFTSFSGKFNLNSESVYSSQFNNTGYYSEDLVFIKFNSEDLSSKFLFTSKSNVKNEYSIILNGANKIIKNNDDFYVTSNFSSSPFIKINDIKVPNNSGNGDTDLLIYKYNINNQNNNNLLSNSPVCPNSEIKLQASGGTTYSWTGPNNFTSNLQNPTIPNATPAMSGNYSCVISGSGDCDGTFTVEVKVEDKTAPVPNIVNLPDIKGDCKTGVSVIPTATDACAGNIIATTNSPLQYSIPGTYVVVWDYDDGNGNIAHQTQNVIISSPALPTANASQEFCATVYPTISNLQISGQYVIWYDASGTALDPTSKLTNGEYYASQNINGCESDKIKVSVKINATALPTANANQDFCSTQNAKISDLKVNGTNLKFYDATGNALAGSTILQDNTSYFVTQTVNSCESEQYEINVVISQNALPADGDSIAICNDTTSNTKTEDLTKYQENLISGSASYLFEYFDQNQVAISDFKNRTLSIGQNLFYVKVSTADGCYKIVELRLQLNAKPEINLPETAEFCLGKSVNLEIPFNANYTYEWNTGETTNAISVNKENTYSVKVTTNFGCTSTASVIVRKFLIAEILKVEITNNNAKIILSTTGDFEYSLDNVSFQTSNEFKNLENGNYTVYVRTKLGCIIGERDFSIFNIANSFTPNGDGKNDTWKISGLENYPNSEVSVYDAQGKRVHYQITSGAFEWDGKLNSRALPTATYWYNIKVSDGRILSGYLLLKNRN